MIMANRRRKCYNHWLLCESTVIIIFIHISMDSKINKHEHIHTHFSISLSFSLALIQVLIEIGLECLLRQIKQKCITKIFFYFQFQILTFSSILRWVLFSFCSLCDSTRPMKQINRLSNKKVQIAFFRFAFVCAKTVLFHYERYYIWMRHIYIYFYPCAQRPEYRWLCSCCQLNGAALFNTK